MKPTKNNLIIKADDEADRVVNGIISELFQHSDKFIRTGRVQSLGIAVNDGVVNPEKKIKEGSEIAFFGDEATPIDAHGERVYVIPKGAVVYVN